jgi:cyclic dehypoxanthinyl futalosine synthase
LDLLDGAAAGIRLSPGDALDIYEHADFHDLVAAAHDARLRLHPERIVTYAVDRNINYTNICASGCAFCAFFRKPGSPDAYTLSADEIASKVRELEDAGGTQVLLQGGLLPGVGLEFYETMLREIRMRSKVHLHAFSPPEIVHISRTSDIGVEEAIRRLIRAGLGSIPGGGAEILCDRVRRRISPRKCTADEWLGVMRTAHGLGLRTTATMMFGHAETLAERIEHLERIRTLQDETGGFTAFIAWSFQPGNTALGGRPAGGIEYLRTLAISRLYLDNVPNLQASWVTQGSKIAEISLLAGANDLGGTTMEENVVRSAGTSFTMDETEMRKIAISAGFTPRKRDTLYNILETADGE